MHKTVEVISYPSTMSTGRLIVVSGASRGVGVGICRQTLKLDAKADVVVTARNLDRAKEIRDELAKALPSVQHVTHSADQHHQRVHAYQCDVTDEVSCSSLVDMLVENGLLPPLSHSIIDSKKDDKDAPAPRQQQIRPLSLVNNAGIALDVPWIPAPWSSSFAYDTLNVNLYGAERLTRAFLPHLLNSTDGRVIFVSSGAGRTNMKRMEEGPRNKLLSEDLTWDDIQTMADTFQKEYETAAGEEVRKTGLEQGDKPQQQLPFLSPSSGLWLQSYGFSKACLGAYCQILARKYPPLFSIACSPGFIQTDMTRQYGKFDELKSVEEGGEVEAWLATTDDRGTLQSGVFYQPNQIVVSWVNE